jgi:hypothetical protein
MDQTRLAASKQFAVCPFCERRNILRQYAEKAWNSIRRQSKDRSDFDEDENLDRPAAAEWGECAESRRKRCESDEDSNLLVRRIDPRSLRDNGTSCGAHNCHASDDCSIFSEFGNRDDARKRRGSGKSFGRVSETGQARGLPH